MNNEVAPVTDCTRPAPEEAAPAGIARLDRVILLTGAASLARFLAFPPLEWSPVIWLAPAFWAGVIALPIYTASEKQSQFSHIRKCLLYVSFYLKVWLVESLFWLAILYSMSSLPVPFIVTWVLMSATFSLPVALFIWIGRVCLWQWKLPMFYTLPIVWCGIEWCRKTYFFNGVGLCSLEHALYRQSFIIQIADLCGEYLVGMLVIFVGTGLYCSVVSEHLRSVSSARWILTRRQVLTTLAFTMLATVAYGRYHLVQFSNTSTQPPVAKVALLQDVPRRSTPFAPAKTDSYQKLSQAAGRICDVVVWPEVSCSSILYDLKDGYVPEGWEGQPALELAKQTQRFLRSNREEFRQLAAKANAHLVVGANRKVFESSREAHEFNSAILISPVDGVLAIYDKQQLVPFWETATPLDRVLPKVAVRKKYQPGCRDGVVTIPTATGTFAEHSPSFRAAISICFDSFVPHFIRNQVATAKANGQEPDVLINLSNDLAPPLAALHLPTHVFRAVENRKDYLVAVQSGSAVWIAKTGAILKQGPRDEPAFVVAEVHRHRSSSLYRSWGDWLPKCCALFVTLIAVAGMVAKFRQLKK